MERKLIGTIREVFSASEAARMAKELYGIEIPEAAFQHNLEAWQDDYKSGFVAGDYFIFSPCGCNPLRFDIYENDGSRKTYIA